MRNKKTNPTSRFKIDYNVFTNKKRIIMRERERVAECWEVNTFSSSESAQSSKTVKKDEKNSSKCLVSNEILGVTCTRRTRYHTRATIWIYIYCTHLHNHTQTHALVISKMQTRKRVWRAFGPSLFTL